MQASQVGIANVAAALASVPDRIALLGQQDGLYIVGGWLREAYLGLDSSDLDLAVSGDFDAALKRLASALGTQPFCLNARFGTWSFRVKGWEIDVSPTIGGLDGDLSRRDYTVNTLRLSTHLLGKQPTDAELAAGLEAHPLAFADLEARVLRSCGPDVMADDPLRVLRGYRLAATLGMQVESQTRSQWSGLAGKLLDSSPERIHTELLRWFSAPDVAAYGVPSLSDTLAWAAEDGVLWQIFPQLQEGINCEQNRYHHLGVWDHTLECLNQLEQLRAHLPKQLMPWQQQLSESWSAQVSSQASAGVLTRIALLLHDIAKPATREVQQDGRTTFYGHQDIGAQWMQERLAALKFSSEENGYITKLIAEHLRLGFYCVHDPLPPRLAYRFLSRLGEASATMVLHTLADCAATRGDDSEANWARHLACAAQLLHHHFEPGRVSQPPLLLDGVEIMEIRGLQPGRLVGVIKAALLEATAAGEVSTLEDARTFVLSFDADSTANA